MRRMRRHDALEQVFTTRWVLEHAADEEKTLLKQAFQAVSEADIGDHPGGLQIAPASPAAAFRQLP
jgi:hypothetical protein